MSDASSPDCRSISPGSVDDREDLERLLGNAEQPTLTPDGKWRAEYRKAQHQRQLAGVQPDMFDAPATMHFHRNPKPPAAEDWLLDYDVTRFHDLSPEEQARQLVAHPQTPWTRTTRKRLKPEERASMVAGAANWLRLGQRVGVVWRLCSPVFADYVYVNLDLVGQERSEKVVFIELRDIVPIDN